MQIWFDFMARFKKNNAAKNRRVCQVEREKAEKREKRSRIDASKTRRGLDMSCVWKKVNQQSVNWIQVL